MSSPGIGCAGVLNDNSVQLLAPSHWYSPNDSCVIVLLTEPLRRNEGELWTRVIVPVGIKCTRLVIGVEHAPKLVIVPEPVMTTVLVSTESSSGEIATVAAAGIVTGGASPCAQFQGMMAIKVQHLRDNETLWLL